MRFTGADGGVLAETEWVQEKSQLRTFKYIGKRAKDIGKQVRQKWPEGNYHGVIKVVRPSGSGKRHTVHSVALNIELKAAVTRATVTRAAAHHPNCH